MVCCIIKSFILYQWVPLTVLRWLYSLPHNIIVWNIIHSSILCGYASTCNKVVFIGQLFCCKNIMACCIIISLYIMQSLLQCWDDCTHYYTTSFYYEMQFTHEFHYARTEVVSYYLVAITKHTHCAHLGKLNVKEICIVCHLEWKQLVTHYKHV